MMMKMAKLLEEGRYFYKLRYGTDDLQSPRPYHILPMATVAAVTRLSESQVFYRLEKYR
jgi:hypothetical protein